MKKPAPKRVFLVDDEPKVCEAICETLTELPVDVVSFSNAPDCLKQLETQKCDLLITDINMPNMDGMELLKEAKRILPLLPVIIITGYGDVPKAVRAMKDGAFNFIEKPLDEDVLLPLVKTALRSDTENEMLGQKLTRREKEILELVIKGQSNKEIAALLHRSTKTIEFHRYRLMQKLDAHNLADLIRIAGKMGLQAQ